MSELKYHTDPDGTRWVGIEITEEQATLLEAPGALAVYARELDAAMRRYAEKSVDEEVAALVRIEAAK